MIPNSRNDYVDTIKPILYCLRINGVLPAQLKIKNHTTFLECRIMSVITQFVYSLNFVYNLITLLGMAIHIGRNFSLKILVAFAPQVSLKLIIIIIPLHMWTKARQLQNYWNNWKEFQDKFEQITAKTFNSNIGKKIRRIIFIATSLIIMAEIIVQRYIPYDTDYLRFISDYLNISVAYYIGAFWHINCIYVKTIAKEIISLTKKTSKEEKNGNKLHEIIFLWMSSCELMEKFYVIHSILLLVYIMETIMSMTIFAFICMNQSTFLDIYGVGIQLNGLFVCIFIIFLICETGYSVYKQIVIKQRNVLLQQDTMEMDTKLLQSVSVFLETIFVRNPGIYINGYLTLNRSVFASILAVCINYLIVLRQFQ